jgi:hypothetical protein
MKKWLFLFALSLHMLPYHGAITLQLPLQELRHMCDGPCSPVHEFVMVPCDEEACVARPERINEDPCTPLQSPQHESAPSLTMPTTLFTCAPEMVRVSPPNAPHIVQTILTTQKKE